MALLTVTLGVNQHVAGIGTTLLLVAACDFTNRLLFGGGERTVTAKFDRLFSGGGILAQYPMTSWRSCCWRRRCGGCSGRPGPACG